MNRELYAINYYKKKLISRFKPFFLVKYYRISKWLSLISLKVGCAAVSPLLVVHFQKLLKCSNIIIQLLWFEHSGSIAIYKSLQLGCILVHKLFLYYEHRPPSPDTATSKSWLFAKKSMIFMTTI